MDSYIFESGKINLFGLQPKPHDIVESTKVACKPKRLAQFLQNYTSSPADKISGRF